jgi:hypothetical protein
MTQNDRELRRLERQIKLYPAQGWRWRYHAGIGYILEEKLDSRRSEQTLKSQNNNGGNLHASTSLGAIR